MLHVRAYLRKNPVLSFFVFVFVISWGGALWVVGGLSNIPILKEDVANLFFPAYLATVAGPSLGSVLLTALVQGKAGLRALLASILQYRAQPRWYAIAILSGPVTVLIALFGLSFCSSDFTPGFLAPATSATGDLNFPVIVIVFLSLFNGFVEELGWTGFAIPRMLERYSVFVTGAWVGLLWGAWHFMSNYLLSAGAEGELPMTIYMLGLLFTFLPPFRILMVWVYEHTQSLFIAIIMHASLDMIWLLSTPRGVSAGSLITWYVVWAAVLWMAVGGIWMMRRKLVEHKVVALP